MQNPAPQAASTALVAPDLLAVIDDGFRTQALRVLPPPPGTKGRKAKVTWARRVVGISLLVGAFAGAGWWAAGSSYMTPESGLAATPDAEIVVQPALQVEGLGSHAPALAGLAVPLPALAPELPATASGPRVPDHARVPPASAAARAKVKGKAQMRGSSEKAGRGGSGRERPHRARKGAPALAAPVDADVQVIEAIFTR